MLWNAQSIRSKINEVTNFLQSKHIDICLISETWLKQDESCSVKNYTLYRKDRHSLHTNKRNIGGGVAVAIRNDIPHKEIPDLGLDIIETVGIEVQGMHIYSAYFPGSKLNSQKLQAFKSDIIKISSIRKNFLIGGDFNSKHRFWNCAKRNKAGQILFEEMSKRNFTVHFPNSPTYFPPQVNKTMPSTVDVFLTNGYNGISDVSTINDLSSDHLPVCFKVEFSSTFKSIPQSQRCYAKANWPLYKDYISNSIDLIPASRFDTIMQIDDAIEKFTALIKRAENLAIPYIKHRKDQPSVDDVTQDLISLRNCKRRQWQRSGTPALKKEINFLNRQIKSRIKSYNNERWNTRLSQLKNHSNQMWKVTKILNNPTKKIPPLKSISNILTMDADKANEIGSAFCKAHSTTFNDLSDPSTESAVGLSYNNINFFLPLINESCLPTPREISTLIRGFKNKKSPGDDSINNILLKQLPKKAIVLIMHIFRACFKISYFPSAWKCAKVVPIPKPGKDQAVACNYRPISLLNSLSKILEKLILSRLNSHISAHKLLNDEQFGFRTGHSTNHQLLRVCNYIRESLKKKHSTGMVTFDIEKAFDSVWHKGLLHKLFLLKFPLYIIKIIQSFLFKRSFYVSINNDKSKIFQILAGVPQGSVLSPTLYNVYTSDLNITSSEKAFFADDTCLYKSAKSPGKIIKHLNAATKQLTDYSTKWKIKLNDAKTNATFFTRRRAQKWLPSEGITIRNSKIAWKNSTRYLGVTLDKTLTFKPHVELIQGKALKFLGALYPILNRKSKLNNINKIRIFRAIIQSILLGACPVWGNCANHHIEKLQIIQNKCLKIIFSLPTCFRTNDLHGLASIPLITQQISKINLNFRTKMLCSDNPIISSLH
jgi:Reverse transcriptase (RNA-dependent DNA polymerase)/Endonuclease-reverse transcriptase